MGLMAIYPGPNLSKPAPGHKIYPYLLGNVEIERVAVGFCIYEGKSVG